jgi:hypothetical protein
MLSHLILRNAVTAMVFCEEHLLIETLRGATGENLLSQRWFRILSIIFGYPYPNLL